MWSARLPGELVDQLVEAADEEGVSQADLVEQIFGEWLDARALSHVREPAALSEQGQDGLALIEKGADDVPELERTVRKALTDVVELLDDCDIEHAILCVKCADEDGVVVGLVDAPLQLLAEIVEFATIVAAAAGRQFRVVMDGDGR